jgi:hypothetical protein
LYKFQKKSPKRRFPVFSGKPGKYSGMGYNEQKAERKGLPLMTIRGKGLTMATLIFPVFLMSGWDYPQTGPPGKGY